MFFGQLHHPHPFALLDFFVEVKRLILFPLLDEYEGLRAFLEQIHELSLLCRSEGMCMQQVHPGIRYLDPLQFIVLVVGLKALAVGMDDELADFIWEYGVNHIPEVLSLALPALRIRIREVWLQLFMLQEDGVHGFDRNLIILSELDGLNFLLS